MEKKGYIISYSKRGTDRIPDEWAFGEVVRYKTIERFYDGYFEKFENRNEAIERAKVLKVITKYCGYPMKDQTLYADVRLFEGNLKEINKVWKIGLRMLNNLKKNLLKLTFKTKFYERLYKRL